MLGLCSNHSRSALLGLISFAALLVSVSFVVVDADDSLVLAQSNSPPTACPSNVTYNGSALTSGLTNDCGWLLSMEAALEGAGNDVLNWDSSTAMAGWNGVTVSGTPLRVTQLDLRNKVLKGTIPVALGNLSELTVLRLYNNGLTGEIPEELGGLSKLKVLRLENNNLTGAIPTELGDLSLLEHLSLNANNLTGAIPAALGNLSLIQGLLLHENNLTGTIPPELGDVGKDASGGLRNLKLGHNKLTGSIPGDLGKLNLNGVLNLEYNDLSGRFPAQLFPEFNGLDGVTSLSLNYNKELLPSEPGGSLFKDLGKFTTLRNVGLSGIDSLSGTDLNSHAQHLGNWKQVQSLLALDNDMTGSLSALTNLTYTDDNDETKMVLANLRQLVLRNNKLTGEIPADLGKTRLYWLDLGNNRLSGEVPDLTNLKNTHSSGLQCLCLSQNRLSGQLPSWLGDPAMRSTYVLLNGNQFRGPIPSSLGNATYLTWLYLNDNNLTGSIPAELGNLSRLQRLSLSNNQFSGDIPSSLGNATYLTWLYLNDNNLTGSIPAELGNLSRLQRLSLSNNQLSGEIPSSMGNATYLTWLYLNDNNLTGSIPAELGNLSRLQRLILSNNQLSGSLPSWLSNLDLRSRTSMQRVLIEGNHFVDDVSSVTLRGAKFDLAFDLGDAAAYISTPSGATPAGHKLKFSVSDMSGKAAPDNRTFARGNRFVGIDMVDSTDNDVSSLGRSAAVCLSIPADQDDIPSSPSFEHRLYHLGDAPNADWIALNAPEPQSLLSRYRTGYACGLTNEFSTFVVNIKVKSGFSWISRIAPSIRSVVLSPGDRVRLAVDIYGRQNILDNSLGDGVTFEWSVSPNGGEFSEVDSSEDGDSYPGEREVMFTAPSTPGRYTVNARLGPSECNDMDGLHDGCDAGGIEVKVRRLFAVQQPTATPADPSGVIPAILTDSEGNQYEVFTPVGGGTFAGAAVTVSAGPGAIPNGEAIGIRAEAGDQASNVGQTHRRVTLRGMYYEVYAVDLFGEPLSGYVLDDPIDVCVPLHPRLAANIGNVVLVSTREDGTYTMHSTKVMLDDEGLTICGKLSELSAKVAAAYVGSPSAMPTPTPVPAPEAPDTGGYAPSASFILWLMILSAAALAVAGLIAKSRHWV